LLVFKNLHGCKKIFVFVIFLGLALGGLVSSLGKGRGFVSFLEVECFFGCIGRMNYGVWIILLGSYLTEF
jgi:hypothetical protein